MKIFYKQKLLSVYFIRQLYRTRSIGLPGYLLTSGALTEEAEDHHESFLPPVCPSPPPSDATHNERNFCHFGEHQKEALQSSVWFVSLSDNSLQKASGLSRRLGVSLPRLCVMRLVMSYRRYKTWYAFLLRIRDDPGSIPGLETTVFCEFLKLR